MTVQLIALYVAAFIAVVAGGFYLRTIWDRIVCRVSGHDFAIIDQEKLGDAYKCKRCGKYVFRFIP